MAEESHDTPVLNHIQQLASEEHALFNKDALSDADRDRLDKIKVELDRCWDLLRQREARRSAGQDPSKAHLRPAKIVENYEQ